MSAEDEELQQLRETIAELEKFHQAMPEDRQTLEILAVAYGKVGDAAGQIRALGGLAGVLVRQKDWEHARIIAENLRSFADDPAAQAAADQANQQALQQKLTYSAQLEQARQERGRRQYSSQTSPSVRGRRMWRSGK